MAVYKLKKIITSESDTSIKSSDIPSLESYLHNIRNEDTLDFSGIISMSEDSMLALLFLLKERKIDINTLIFQPSTAEWPTELLIHKVKKFLSEYPKTIEDQHRIFQNFCRFPYRKESYEVDDFYRLTVQIEEMNSLLHLMCNKLKNLEQNQK